MLDSSTHKKQRTHSIYKVVVFLQFAHKLVFRQEFYLVVTFSTHHQAIQLKFGANVLREVHLLIKDFIAQV